MALIYVRISDIRAVAEEVALCWWFFICDNFVGCCGYMTKQFVGLLSIALVAVFSFTAVDVSAQGKKVFTEGKILDINKGNGQGIISIGKNKGAKTGDKFIVIRPGEKIIDPSTKKLIRFKQTVIGEVEVISATKTYSDVKITKGAGDVVNGDGVRRRTSPPQGLVVKAEGFRKNKLTWRLQEEPESTGYVIYRSVSSKKDFKKIGDTSRRDKVTYLDQHSRNNKLKDNTKYYYKVAAVNSLKVESKKSSTVSVKTKNAPLSPKDFRGVGGKIRATSLLWAMHTNEEVAGYKIYRSANKPKGPKQIADIRNRKTSSYDDFGLGSSSSPKLETDTKYYYSISAYSPFGHEGPKSKPIKVATAGPPTIPKSFEALGWQPRKVPLSWKPIDEENVRGYLIYRSSDEKGPYEQIAEIKDPKIGMFIDTGAGSGFGQTGLSDFAIYFYKIQTFDWAGGRSRMSAPISATTKAAPLPPESVTAQSSRPKQVPLAWRRSPEPDIKEYIVYRASRKDGEFKKIATLGAKTTIYMDGKLKNDSKYYYKMKVADKTGLISEYSSIVSASTKMLPAKVKGIDWEKKEEQVTLKWSRNRERDLKHYKIYKKGFFGWSAVGESKKNSFVIPDFKSGDKDNFAVSAVDADGLEGEPSGTLTIDLR